MDQYVLFTEVRRSHSDTSRLVWLLWMSDRPVADNAQHSQETDFHYSGGIQSCIPSKRAAAELADTGHRPISWLPMSKSIGRIINLNKIVVLCLTVYKCYLLSPFSFFKISPWGRLAHKLLFSYRKLANKTNNIFHPSHLFFTYL